MPRTFRLLAALMTVTTGMGSVGAAYGAEGHWAVPLRAQLVRLNTVDWRLAVLAAPRCQARAAGTGMALDSLAAYPLKERAAIGEALAMAEGVIVVAVAEASPAAEAGIAAGDRLLALEGVPVERLGGTAPDLIAETITDHLAGLAPDRPIVMSLARAGETREVTLMPKVRCAPRSTLQIADRIDAWSDEANVALTTGMLGFVANDDELALIAGHELAHIILAPELAAQGIRGKRKEQAADKLGAEIAACAGYDIALASRFWARFDGTRLLGFLPTATHPRSKNRLGAIEALATSVDCAPFASPAA